MSTYDPTPELEELRRELENLEYDLSRIRERLEEEIPEIEELVRQAEYTENHECEYHQWHIEQLLRADDSAQEDNHARLLEHYHEPQPVCPWCKETVGIVYRQSRQYLLRCSCRVIYVRADSPIAAARKLRLETGE